MTHSRADELHALYRFFDAEDALLYVGITFDPTQRFAAHRDDKPWWTSVTRIQIETHPDRATALAAERAAIIAEAPRYNLQHNGGGPAPTTTSAAARAAAPCPPRRVRAPRLHPLQPRDWVALALSDGSCPVGQIEAMDETWLSVRLKSAITGELMSSVRLVRRSEVEQVAVAYAEDFEPADDADNHGGVEVDDEHLVALQTAWLARSRS